MKKYSKFIYTTFKEKTTYLTSFIISIISLYIQMISVIFIWIAVFKNQNNTLNGYTVNEMILYLILSFTILATVYQGIANEVSSDISKGDIVIYLIKPMSYITKLIFQSIATILFNMIWLLPVLIIALIYFNSINLSFINLLIFILSLIFSCIILFILDLMVGLTAFYVNYIWGFLLMKETLFRFFSGELFPISFLPMPLQKVLDFLPFNYISYKPIMLLLSKIDTMEGIKMLIIQMIWIVILFILASLQYRSANRRLAINGG